MAGSAHGQQLRARRRKRWSLGAILAYREQVTAFFTTVARARAVRATCSGGRNTRGHDALRRDAWPKIIDFLEGNCVTLFEAQWRKAGRLQNGADVGSRQDRSLIRPSLGTRTLRGALRQCIRFYRRLSGRYAREPQGNDDDDLTEHDVIESERRLSWHLLMRSASGYVTRSARTHRV